MHSPQGWKGDLSQYSLIMDSNIWNAARGYNGCDQSDVLNYHQKLFLPAMQQYQSWMVEYNIGEVKTELIKQLWPGKKGIVWWHIMNQWCRQMMARKRAGYWKDNSHWRRRVLEEDSIRAMLFTWLMGDLRVQVLQWNMARIVKGIG